MNGRYILDTNIVIALFGNNVSILDKMNEASSIYVPIIVIGELLFGAMNSIHVQNNINKIFEFTMKVNILSFNIDTAFYYGKIKKQLKDIGKPIPENDIWISSLSQQYQIPLVS